MKKSQLARAVASYYDELKKAKLWRNKQEMNKRCSDELARVLLTPNCDWLKDEGGGLLVKGEVLKDTRGQGFFQRARAI